MENVDLRLRSFKDFSGGPVGKTSPSNAGDVGSIPGWGAKITHALGPKPQNMKVKIEREVAQLYSTLCDPMGCSPPASSVHGIFQVRVLEWGAIAFSTSDIYCKYLLPFS